MNFTDEEINVLTDVLNEVMDVDRHGKLDEEYGWSDAQVEIFRALNQRVWNEAKGRGFWWAR